MTQLFYAQNNATVTDAVKIGPPPGKIWKIVQAYISLTSGSTVGARNVVIFLGSNSGTSSLVVAETSQPSTSASTTTGGVGGPSNAGGDQDGGAGGTVTVFTYPVVVTYGHTIESAGTLISGDSWDWELQIEEVDA